MKYLNWNESYSVHIEEIDAQHQWLTDIINTLYDELSENKGKRLLEIVSQSLIQYTQIHFATEENLMIQYDYPGYNDHKNKHEILTKKVMEWNNTILDGHVALTKEMLEFLKTWFENHETHDDKPLGEFLTVRGVK